MAASHNLTKPAGCEQPANNDNFAYKHDEGLTKGRPIKTTSQTKGAEGGLPSSKRKCGNDRITDTVDDRYVTNEDREFPQRKNRYTNKSKAPFAIIVPTKTNNIGEGHNIELNLGRLHPMRIGMKLESSIKGIKVIERKNKRQVEESSITKG